MEFWGVEVECGMTAKVYPPIDRVLHITQVTLGFPKEEETITGPIYLKVNRVDDGSTFSMGSLSIDKVPQLSCDLSFDKGFELSHSWDNGSVYFCGHHISDRPILYLPNHDTDVESFMKSPFQDPAEFSLRRAVVSASKTKIEAPHKRVSSSPTHPNKRPKLIDSPSLSDEESTFAVANFITSLQQGKIRVKELLSESDSCEDLRKLEAHFDDLLPLISTSTLDASQKDKLCELTKHILELWESIEHQIEQRRQSCAYQLPMRPSDYPRPVPSSWVVMPDWQDQAYRELVSIRNKHSNLLDLAYKEKHTDFYKSNKGSSLDLLMHKKCVNFLASSSDDIRSLSKKKCYHWVMKIKLIVSKEKYETCGNPHEGLPEPPASSHNLADWTQGNWRDRIYEKIVDSRKMNSCKLDEAYRKIYHTWVKGGKFCKSIMKDVKALLKFLLLFIQFLGKSRADLVFYSEEDCMLVLDRIRLFVESSTYSTPAMLFRDLQQSQGYWIFRTEHETSPTYWRDVAYRKLQSKVDRFSVLLYDGVYLKRKEEWSKEPRFADLLSELDTRMSEARKLFGLPRCSMALFASVDAYFELVDKTMDALIRIKDIVKELEGGVEPTWNPRELVPKALEAVSLQ